MTDNSCNCGNKCDKITFYGNYGMECSALGKRVESDEYYSTKQTGCLSHPQAREYLMKDVIDDLERRSHIPSTHRCSVWVIAIYEEAITLIKGEVEK